MAQLPAEFITSIENIVQASGELIHSLDGPSPVSIRFNSRKGAFTRHDPIPWCTTGTYLAERPVFTLDPSLHAGKYYVQEASSMFLEQVWRTVVKNQTGLKILDLSAAPGGKSTHLLDLMHDDDLLVSNEVIRSRASILAENIQKWGRSNVVVTNSDPQVFSRLVNFFDIIVIDAPCSGEGMFRKDPASIAEWSPAHVELCASRQRRIIEDVWPALKKDGVLIYSTCTYNEKENEQNLNWLMANEGAVPIPIECDLQWGIEQSMLHNAIGYRFYPHRIRGEGFFIAALRKETGEEQHIKSKRKLETTSKNISGRLREWLHGEMSLFTHQEFIFAFPSAWQHELEVLSDHLHIISAGTATATPKHDKLIPEHALALATILRQEQFPVVDVTYDEAIRFLRKDTLHFQSSGTGFHLIRYEGNGIGWANILPNRTNNLYPQEWRIRMSGH